MKSMCITCLFPAGPLPPLIFLNCSPQDLLSSLILPRLRVAVTFILTWKSSNGILEYIWKWNSRNALLTSCGTLLATSRTLAPGRQHTSCDYQSGQQMDASVRFNRESPTVSTSGIFCTSHCMLLVELLLMDLAHECLLLLELPVCF